MDWLWTNPTETREGSKVSSVFCGFATGEEEDARNDRHETYKSNLDGHDEYRDVPDPNSSLWSAFWNKMRNDEQDMMIKDGSIIHDDDSSVVSNSDVSVFSIDNHSVEHLAGGRTANLSEIGDDESTVASVDDNSQMPTSESAMKISQESPKPSLSFSLNQIDENASKSADYSISNSKTEGEKRRKDLLVLLRNNMTKNGRYSLPVAKNVVQIAEFHETTEEYQMAQTLYSEALSIYSSILGDHDLTTNDILIRLGHVNVLMGRDEDALCYYCRALNMIVAISSMYDVNASNVRVNIARIHQNHGRNKESVKELKKALRGYREKHGDEHITVADTVDHIADVYTEGGNHEKANSVRAELVKLRVALHGNKCVEVAGALEKWALSHEAMNDYNSALKVMKQAYVMYHEVEENGGPRTEVVLRKIGEFYAQLGRGEKSIKAYTSLVVMTKMKYPENDSRIAESYSQLGKAFSDAKMYDKALRALNRAMSLYGAANNTENSNVGPMMDTLHEVGMTYHKMEKYQQALKALFKEFSIRKKLENENELSIACTLREIGNVYSSTQNYESGKKFLREALFHYDRANGRKIAFAETLCMYGEVHDAMGDSTDEARCAYEEALCICNMNGLERSNQFVECLLKLLNVSDYDSLKPSSKCSVLDGNSATRRIEI